VTIDVTTELGPVRLRTPLVGAAGTMGSVYEFEEVADLSVYGACVAKSVSGEPWTGRPAPRVAPAGAGMLNGIGIQNPGIDEWASDIGPRLEGLDVPVWGSAVGERASEFARVAVGLAGAGVDAIEINLSCPNLDDGRMFALDPERSAEVVSAVREAVDLPLGAKLSPNSEDIGTVARACVGAGADWLVLTNTVWGAAVDLATGQPVLSGRIGGYSGPPMKPIAMRCVLEVHEAMPEVPILACGGVSTGRDVAEYLVAGASAVAMGTIHFAEPRAAARILSELRTLMRRMGVGSINELRGLR
jgi:dihydroorotate dehydrogenase (NAD+) catalytic subunit